MKNATGSKSARNAKTTTPAHGGPPEVTLDSGTVAVLPNPADAPAPAKAPARKKTTPAPAAEVPGWAKRAAARNTPAEMAAAPGAAPMPETTAPAKVRAVKPPKPKATAKTPTAAAGSLRAIGTAWIDSIRSQGHTPSTVSSYSADLEAAYEFLGETTTAADITEKQIAKFNACDLVMKKRNGKGRAMPTILKTRRALRLALVWAEQKGLIKKAPFATKTPA